jgi:manganese transport protein
LYCFRIIFVANILKSNTLTWKSENTKRSLPEVHGTISVGMEGSFFRKLRYFIGPGFMVSVGYMDPGNWATDLAGGSKFGYALLSVILISNMFAIILQHLALKLGIVAGRDLAQACRDAFGKKASFVLWIFAEIAIAATDLAEVIGSAIALQLLFNIPIPIGILITVLDVMLILFMQNKSFRFLEIVVACLTFTIFMCFGYELLVSNPDFEGILGGLLPSAEIVSNPEMLLIAIGILGATVMPHNLYLHSSIVQTRDYGKTIAGIKHAIKFATIDSTLSLFLAFFVNAAILILAAASFHKAGMFDVVDIHQAYKLLDPVLGAKYAGLLFAVALLASGQNATLTGTLSGQIVMEGFLEIKLKPWLRRLITRLVAIVPAFFVAIYFGNEGTGKLLIMSQVVLSLQLSFAVVPLIMFTGSKAKMGQFANSKTLNTIAWAIASIIIVLNGYMLLGLLKF